MMNHRCSAAARINVLFLVILVGCSPVQPFFLHEDGDLSHYLDVAMEISYPDVDQPILPDAEQTQRPLSTQNPTYNERWKLTLEQVMSIALHNSKIIRSIAQVAGGFQPVGQTAAGQPQSLTLNPDFSPSIYDPSIEATDDNRGVEAALANFDVQLQTSFTWDRTDRPQNVRENDITAGLVFARLLERDNINYESELSKRTASGTQWFLRNITTYDSNNRPLRELTSEWFTSFEAEVRHPLLRNSGVQINRIPVILARLNTDVRLVDFEIAVRDFVLQVERAYWNLYFYYHALNAARTGFASAHATWKQVNARKEASIEGGEAMNESQARAQYFAFRARLEQAQSDLFSGEAQLRFLMGISASDGRLIEPADEATKTRVEFDWVDVNNEALVRRAELRRQKWRIKQQQLQLMAARNQLLPQFDAIALYRLLGLGDDLARLGSRFGPNFVEAESLALDDLTEGRFTEWQLGFQFQMNLGFRRELSAVRNRELQLRRGEKLLQDQELEITHQMAFAFRTLQDQYRIAQTQFNALRGYRDQVQSAQAAYEIAGNVTLDLLLDAQSRQAQAEVDYFRALTQYNLAIADVHYRKGSLLEYNGVALAEGPWPSKAYFDAQIRARQRDASYYLNYGFTRPSVVSRGPMEQFMNDSTASQVSDVSVIDDSTSDTGFEAVGPTLVEPSNVNVTPVGEVGSIYGTLGL